MIGQILLKKAERSDWKRILNLYSSLDDEDLEYRFFNIHHVFSDEAKQIAQKPDHYTVLALLGDEAIGEATLQKSGEVSVVVSKQERGRGVGKLLFEELVAEARRRKIERLKFYTLPSNAHMIELGRAFGFRVVLHSSLEEEWALDLD